MRVFAVGIGRGAKRSELEAIADSKDNVYMLSNFIRLRNRDFINKFAFGCHSGMLVTYVFVNMCCFMTNFSSQRQRHDIEVTNRQGCAEPLRRHKSPRLRRAFPILQMLFLLLLWTMDLKQGGKLPLGLKIKGASEHQMLQRLRSLIV